MTGDPSEARTYGDEGHRNDERIRGEEGEREGETFSFLRPFPAASRSGSCWHRPRGGTAQGGARHDTALSSLQISPLRFAHFALQAVSDREEALVHWEAVLVVLPCFSGYAALFGLQHEVKASSRVDGKLQGSSCSGAQQARFRIADDSSDASHSFGAAV